MPEPFKNKFGPQAVRQMAVAVRGAWPAFDVAAFEAAATEGLEALELMDRVRHLAAAFQAHLPAAFPEAVAVLLAAMGPVADPSAPEASTRAGEGLGGFSMMAVTRYVANAGLAHFDLALDALGQMTSRFSAEFDVRPFLAADPERAWPVFAAWARSDDVHRRRLASEGSRAFLPWGVRVKALVDDPGPGLAILEVLKDDPSEYVRRSVANHLNDVARTHPARVIAVADRWLVSATPERRKLVRHALRGLLKKAHPGALKLLGFDPDMAVQIEGLTVDESVRPGGALAFSFALVHAGADEGQAIIDYVLDRPLARGRGTKTFRIAQRALPAGATVRYDKTHSFRPVTTRTDRPGQWRLSIRVNGRVLDGADFTLEAP